MARRFPPAPLRRQGGFGTEEEMCLVFVTYYPRVDLAVCSSQPNMSEILEGINVEDLHIVEQVRSVYITSFVIVFFYARVYIAPLYSSQRNLDVSQPLRYAISVTNCIIAVTDLLSFSCNILSHF